MRCIAIALAAALCAAPAIAQEQAPLQFDKPFLYDGVSVPAFRQPDDSKIEVIIVDCTPDALRGASTNCPSPPIPRARGARPVVTPAPDKGADCLFAPGEPLDAEIARACGGKLIPGRVVPQD